ncbi:MAG: FAD-dependent thymidylate synthase [Flavobacteriaceae bacterium]|nr:FAD-dependent thymidylate synthase [Flavobacteriaceae bacterium]
MSVKLVSITLPEMSGLTTPEELISYCARVSNPSNQMNMDSSSKLISYLIKHKHWSPFEMVDMTVSIVTRRSIAAQILRHRSFSFQEFSQRYSTATDVQQIELRKQGKTNRQSSEEIILDYTLSKMVDNHLEKSKELYQYLIDEGVSRETARDVLPLATETTMYMKGSVRSWIHYLDLRCSHDTQLEHRHIADNIKDIFKENFPNIFLALGW